MIADLKLKIKQYETEIFVLTVTVFLIIILTGIFRLLTLRRGRGMPIIQENASPVSFLDESSEPGQSQQAFVASKNGAKFYPVGCRAAERIKPENRVFFATAIEAQKAGFELTVACP